MTSRSSTYSNNAALMGGPSLRPPIRNREDVIADSIRNPWTPDQVRGDKAVVKGDATHVLADPIRNRKKDVLADPIRNRKKDVLADSIRNPWTPDQVRGDKAVVKGDATHVLADPIRNREKDVIADPIRNRKKDVIADSIRNPWTPDQVRGDKAVVKGDAGYVIADSIRNPWFCGLLAALLLVLAGCAAPQADVSAPEVPHVFPPPPAQASYVFERSVYEAADLSAKDSAPGFMALLAGTRRVAAEGLSRPLALAAHQGWVAVVNSLDPSVSVFDFNRREFSRLNLGEGGAQRAPVGISVDRNGAWYVADSLSGYVLVLDAQGRLLRKIGGPRWLSRLVNVTVDASAQRVYALDQSEGQHRVRVFNAVTGSHLLDIGRSGDAAGEFNLPVDAAVGPGGRLYVVDSGNFRVQIFNSQGDYVSSFGTAGKRAGQFLRPKEIATDAQGLVYVADATLGNVQVFSADGVYQYAIGVHGDQGADATYMLPSGVALDSDGRLYVLDQWYVKLDVYRPVRRRAATATPQ